MNSDLFSRRHGFGGDTTEITIRNDAPQEIREAVLMIAEGELRVGPSSIRSALCAVLRKVPDASNWSEYPNVWEECQYLMREAPWYKVYDFIEMMYVRLDSSGEADRAGRWEALCNDYFLERGVGWRLHRGILESRGSEAFEKAVDSAREALSEAGLKTAAREIHEALRDLSRRPEADLTGAVHHAMAALECTAREVAGDHRATLGEILKRYPATVPRPLDESLSRMWGYASEVARHLREGGAPSLPEA
jgi:hypothetical protein